MDSQRLTDVTVTALDPILGRASIDHKIIRRNRFLEEALELCIAAEMTLDDILRITIKTATKPRGVVEQEIAGALMTLLLLARAEGVDPAQALFKEAYRLTDPKKVARIREKAVFKDQDMDSRLMSTREARILTQSLARIM